MSDTFLKMITARSRERAANAKSHGYMPKLLEKANAMKQTPNRFYEALARAGNINIIAEIKRASPSKGVINANIDVARTARKYLSGGAAAISVLTESEHFQGSVSDLAAAAGAVPLPILRKDFIVDEYQIAEAAAAGASAILLIVAALEKSELMELKNAADDLGIDSLVEVHDEHELDTACEIGASLIGVNNRDLHTLEVSLETSKRLIGHRPQGALMIAESGISSRAEIDELTALGFNGFLIGETLMRSGDPVSELLRLNG